MTLVVASFAAVPAPAAGRRFDSDPDVGPLNDGSACRVNLRWFGLLARSLDDGPPKPCPLDGDVRLPGDGLVPCACRLHAGHRGTIVVSPP